MRLGSWEAVSAFALSLPGTELATYYGRPAVRVAANSRPFLNVGREPESSFVLSIDLDTKQMLMDTDPETFWETPHYSGWPGVLVRFDSKDPERVKALIERARDHAAALPPARPRKRR